MKSLSPEYQRKDDRGQLIQVVTALFKQLNVLRIKRGKQFGGHWHKKKTEVFYVIEGTILLNSATVIKKDGIFQIDPGDRHDLYALTDSILVETLSEPYDKEDVYTS